MTGPSGQPKCCAAAPAKEWDRPLNDREIVFDTETTGLDAEGDDRVVEIGCLELVNHLPTGETFHAYVNPERNMPQGAFEVHGLSEEFLKQHGVFASVADDFLAFIGDAPMIAHNATFDMRFINAEMARLGKPGLTDDRIIDTLAMARTKFPGAQNSLDALCRRFDVDTSTREKDGHGALLDSELLAAVYLELIGGRQPGLVLGAQETARTEAKTTTIRPPRPHAASADELSAHKAFIENEVIDALWLKDEQSGP
ncbi:MAG: DNA polymerase III subunit epsilon [Alphaproteobacteria bacterium]|nr:MAG: DNA polymerase III subunit epsilon [Alphaproteobacteria bacterium]